MTAVPGPGHDPATPESVRAAFRDWLGVHWNPDLPLREWRQRLADDGWAFPSWPTAWGGLGMPGWADDVVAEERRAAGAPGAPVGVATSLVVPTVLEHGPDQLRGRLLRDIATGASSWCQLFSEPGAGSDLAGLTAHAVLDGDRYVVNGQKVWTTSAHHADFGLLLARSDPDAPKHRGITCFALPMDQPGVEVRPLRQMNRRSSFNEVFLDDAEIPVSHVIGGPGRGWDVARTTLAHERRFGAVFAAGTGSEPSGLAAREAAAEAAEYLRTYEWYPQRAGRPDLVPTHVRSAVRPLDPATRAARTDAAVDVVARQRLGAWTAARAAAARRRGAPPGPEGSLGKLTTSEVARRAAVVHGRLAGAFGMLDADPGVAAASDGASSRDTVPIEVIAEVLVSVPAQSIAGGTDEIQRTILGERVLGLPREPDPGRDRPFRDLPRN